jgi:uncharacterized membrane-anchored protein YjiN (DUF445 family)
MTVSGTFSFDAPGDAARAAELRRVKVLATLVLTGTLALFVTAKMLLPVHPVFGFVAAFAEAATIGGLADWYAVVALFRRPLGLPIPHTAIIQSNQHRIADKLGEFIEVHFLEANPVNARLRQIDFGSFIADWLRDRKRSADLARFTLHLLPEAVSATETSGLMTFISRRITTQLQMIDIAPLAAGTLRAFVAEGRHQGLLDDILRAVHQSLTEPETMAMIRAKIRDELPTLLKLYRTDAFLVKKIVASATAFFDDVRNDPKHPFRGEFDRMVLSFVDKLGSDRAYADRVDGLSATSWRVLNSAISRETSGRMRGPLSSAARSARPRCCSSIWPGCTWRQARRSPAIPNCAPRSTRVWSRCSEVSSPIKRAASPASSPIRSRPGTWGS